MNNREKISKALKQQTRKNYEEARKNASALPACSTDDDEVLPCDVLVPPATLIKKGCKVSTLLCALEARKDMDATFKVAITDLVGH